MPVKKKEGEEEIPAGLIVSEPGIDTKTGEPIKRTEVDLSDYHDGKGYIEKATGREFGLCVDEEDERGMTHKLKSKWQYWEGTKDQFEKAFEKK